jgi:hypothetical protein
MLFLLLAVAILAWTAYGLRPWLFAPMSCAAALAAFGVAGWYALAEYREHEGLRREFPFESLEGRLPVARDAPRPKQLSQEAELRLTRLEASVEMEAWVVQHSMLKMLREEKVGLFVNSPGFGVTRMFRPSRESLKDDLRPAASVPQPEPRISSVWPDEDVPRGPITRGEELGRMHEGGVLDFVYPAGFGLVKEGRLVTGFQPHRFSRLPGPAERWAVARLDLVGLLLHEAPVAYVSESLPRMDELREAPTRPLDGFEATALEKLRRGEDLVLEGVAGRARMLGALRSAGECVRCHGGVRGDLLGAFSYVLRRVER